MKVFVAVIIVATILGGFVGGELTDRTFLLTGAVIGGVGVAVVLLGLGAFFSAQDDKRKNRRGAGLPPEIREVFGRMLGHEAKPQTAPAQEKSAPTPRTTDNRETFKTTVKGLIAAQLLPKFSDPKQAFSSLMTNKRAAGYVFGLHDAMLQACGLRKDLAAANKLIEESYQSIFGSNAGYALFSRSLSNQENSEFHAGRLEGGEELTDFVDNKVPPLGLGRILILDAELGQVKEQSEKPPSSGQFGDFSRLIFEIQRVFHRVIKVPSPEDTVTKVLQRDSIYGAISPFAYGLIVMRRATELPAYIDTQEHAKLFAMVENRMTKNRLDIAAGMAKGMPMLPGGLTFQPDAEGIRNKVREELQDSLKAVADGDRLRPMIVAKPNLLQLYTAAAPFSQKPEEKEKLFEAMSEFADGFLRTSA